MLNSHRFRLGDFLDGVEERKKRGYAISTADLEMINDEVGEISYGLGNHLGSLLFASSGHRAL